MVGGYFRRNTDQDLHGYGFALSHGRPELPAAKCYPGRFVHLGHHALIYLKGVNRSVFFQRSLQNNQFMRLLRRDRETLKVEAGIGIRVRRNNGRLYMNNCGLSGSRRVCRIRI